MMPSGWTPPGYRPPPSDPKRRGAGGSFRSAFAGCLGLGAAIGIAIIVLLGIVLLAVHH